MDGPAASPSRCRSTLYSRCEDHEGGSCEVQDEPEREKASAPSMIAATIWLVGALVANVAGPTKKVTTVRSTKRSPANPRIAATACLSSSHSRNRRLADRLLTRSRPEAALIDRSQSMVAPDTVPIGSNAPLLQRWGWERRHRYPSAMLLSDCAKGSRRVL
jgi:hypothetical protein